MEILSSASKIVFILIALTLCAAYLVGIAKGVTLLETKDFMMLATGVFAYYFANKPTDPGGRITK